MPRSSCGSLPAITEAGSFFDDDVGIDAVTFNNVPGRRRWRWRIPGRKPGRHRVAATAADADHATPGALADERAETRLAKHVGENIAVGSRSFVDQTNLRAIEHCAGVSVGLLVDAIEIGAEQIAPEAFDEHLRNVAAAIAADVKRSRPVCESADKNT